jgi:hypothetical protein
MNIALRNTASTYGQMHIDVGTDEPRLANWIPANSTVYNSAQVLSFEELSRRSQLRSLEKVISKCVGSRSIFAPNSIEALTAAYGQHVLSMLSIEIPLPKVTVDGEGGLCLIWEGARTVLATLIRDDLHLTVDPGLPSAMNIDNIKVKGRAIPPELSASLTGV